MLTSVWFDRLEPEDVFTFNVEFDSDGNPDLDKEATSPCHNISAYTNLFLKIFQVTTLAVYFRDEIAFNSHCLYSRSLIAAV